MPQPVQDPVAEPTLMDVTPAPVIPPADAQECFAVADIYLAVTLLPLESVERRDEDDGALPLGRTADSLDDSVDSLPEEVRTPFRAAADQLREAGDGIGPGELTEIRDTLQPVHLWLNQRCSNIELDPTPTGAYTG